LWIAFLVSEQTQGVMPVVKHAYDAGKFEFWPALEWTAIITFIAGFLTLGFGSIPQQDVFQRVNSSKNETVAVWGTILGGVGYFFFAAVPLYLAYSAFIIAPEMSAQISAQDPQRVLPTFMLTNMPLYAQVIFFGALLSVIMSTASGTLLAPSVTLSENVIKELLPNGKNLTDKQLLNLMRLVVISFAILVTLYALYSLEHETSIHAMVENAYKVTLVMALVPLFAGIYWKKASNFGAVCSIVAGVIVWVPLEFIVPDAALPPHFAGFIVAAFAMIIGSLIKPAR
jgi:SSS family solute:Na+ symporter